VSSNITPPDANSTGVPNQCGRPYEIEGAPPGSAELCAKRATGGNSLVWLTVDGIFDGSKGMSLINFDHKAKSMMGVKCAQTNEHRKSGKTLKLVNMEQRATFD
jgi:hypothetical protein